jgi:acetate kinase
MATLYAAKMTNKKLNKLKVITCHLGAGSSITWYDSKVKDTTMGFSPNEGLTMATRSGDIPASVVFFLNQEVKMPLPKIKELLNKKSGLLGLAGMADLREVLLAAGYRVSGYKSSLKFDKKQKDLAKVALQIFIYDIKRYLASYIAMTKKLDAIVFTGAIADNALIRKMILKDLVKPKKCRVLVAPTGETMNLANKTLKCLK